MPDAPVTDPRRVWSPPPHPDWLARLNEEGRCMNIRAILQRDPAELIETVQRNTELSNFGDDDWREPFEILCASLEEDGDLTFRGRLRARSELLLLLRNRLEIEQPYKHYPEIAKEEIVRPLMIIGQG